MRTTWTDGDIHLVRGISWTDRARPVLTTVDIADAVHHLPLPGAVLAFTTEPGRHCIGRSVFVGNDAVTTAPCPRRRIAESGDQCGTCAATDDFRFIHHVHRGGHVPEAMRRYVSQPHWLYVATFADGGSKVGTASQVRQRARLDEQGAVLATYVAHCSDGFTVRAHEDAVTAEAGLPQTVSRRRKVASLCAPLSGDQLAAAHGEAVEGARRVLATRGVHDDPVAWQPPSLHGDLVGGAPLGGWPPLPHDLTAGDHHLTVEAMVGSTALVRMNDEPERFVADLGLLKGRKVTPGDTRSAAVAHQASLF